MFYSSSFTVTVLLSCCVTVAYCANTCNITGANITKTGSWGMASYTKLSLYDCYYPSNWCNPDPVKAATLQRGETKALDHTLNYYAMTGAFFGKEACVAYREYKDDYFWGRRTIIDECKTVCFVKEKEIVYKSSSYCSASGCTFGGTRKMKFVSVAGANSLKVNCFYLALISFLLITTGLVSNEI